MVARAFLLFRENAGGGNQMPIYQWAGISRKGRKLKGEIDAANEKIAMSNLKKRNLTIKKLKPKPKDVFANVSFLQPKVTKKDLVILRQ